MNYELAKKLKDAGFPQPKIGEGLGRDLYPCEGYWHADHDAKCKRAYAPTLSELIEECQKVTRNIGLYEGSRIESGNPWVAIALRPYAQKISDEEMTFGLTPEEAVANLWIILQEEKKGVLP